MAKKPDEVMMQLEAKDKEIAALQARIKEMDATKPGMTDADKQAFDDMIGAYDNRIAADLETALEESDARVNDLNERLAAADAAGKLADAGGTLDVHLIDAMTGSVQVGDMEAVQVVTFARSIASFGKPGVLLVCKVGNAVQVSIMDKMRIVRRGSPDKPMYVLENAG